MKAVVAAFNQEKALVGASSVIVQPVVEPMDSFTPPDIQGEAGRSRYRVIRDNHLDTCLDIQSSSAEGNQIFLMGCSCSGSGKTRPSNYTILHWLCWNKHYKQLHS